MDFSQQILQQHQLLLFLWKLKFLSSRWLIHAVSERCDTGHSFRLRTLSPLKLCGKVEVVFLHWLSIGSFRMRSADTKWPTLRLQNIIFGRVNFKTLLGFFKLFYLRFNLDFFYSFWTHGVRVWTQINWITIKLTGTIKKTILSRNLRNSQVGYCGKAKYTPFGYYEGSKPLKNLISFLFIFYFAD